MSQTVVEKDPVQVIMEKPLSPEAASIPELVASLRAQRVKVMGPIAFVQSWFMLNQAAQAQLRAFYPTYADAKMAVDVRDIFYPAYVRSLALVHAAFPGLD